MSAKNAGAARLAAVGMVGAAVFAVVAMVTSTPAQQQNPAQAACIVAANKSVRGVAKAQSKNIGGCIKSSAKSDPQLTDACIAADLKGRVAKAGAKTSAAAAKSCGTAPDYGYTDVTTINDAASEQEVALASDVFGGDIGAAVLSSTADPTGARCQQSIQKSYEKVIQTQIRAFEACKKSGLSDGSITSQGELEGCFDTMITDPKGKIGKAIVRLTDTVASACGGVDLAVAFPGDCTSPGFADCVAAKSLCRACLMLDIADGTDVTCDLFDNGAADASCVDLRLCGNALNDPGEECDDGNNAGGDCCSPICEASSAGTACADDGEVCTNDVCDGAGACTHASNSLPCDDGLYCNGTDTCGGGACVIHSGDPCASGGECVDACNEAADSCVDAAGTPCTDDGNDCTEDTCNAGSCTHSNKSGGSVCGDASDTECTNPDSCNSSGVCLPNHAASLTACGSPVDDECTNPDSCNGSGSCLANHALLGAACGDGTDTDCTNPDSCNGAGACTDNHAASGAVCGNPANTDCTDPDTCDGAGACLTNDESAGVDCNDDGNPCTDDVCDASGGCTHPPLPSGSACGDPTNTDCKNPDTCNGAGACLSNDEAAGTTCGSGVNTDCDDPDTCNASGICQSNFTTAGVVCTSDGNACTEDLCNGAGFCAHPNLPSGTACPDDAQECTFDQCNGGGVCTHPPKSSSTPCTSDGNVCTNDLCNGAGACAHPANTSSCNDGLFCNGADFCSGGSCVVHGGNPCPGPDGDGNCLESCNEGADNCTAADPNGSGCNDGQSCNGGDSCSSGSCVGSGTCCGTVDFTFTVNSNSGGVFDSAEWPGGQQFQQSSGGCNVTINNPNNNIDLVCTTAGPFSVAGYNGFSNCFGNGGEDGDGCAPQGCPPAGIGSCCATRPSCSAALNGSGSARYHVRCVDP